MVIWFILVNNNIDTSLFPGLACDKDLAKAAQLARLARLAGHQQAAWQPARDLESLE